MRLITMVTAASFLLSAALITGALIAGRLQAPPPTHLEMGGCDRPCWQGFKPGGGLDANGLIARVRELPYSVGRISEYSAGYYPMFEIYPSGKLTLADVLRVWGSPEQVGCLQVIPRPTPKTIGALYFFDGLVAVQVVAPDDGLRLSPGMRVSAIQYYQPGDPVYGVGKTVDWHGFAAVPVYLACYAP